MWLSAKNKLPFFFLIGAFLSASTVRAGIVLEENVESADLGKPNPVARIVLHPAAQHDLKWEVVAGNRAHIILAPVAVQQLPQSLPPSSSPSFRGRQNHVLRARAYRLTH